MDESLLDKVAAAALEAAPASGRVVDVEAGLGALTMRAAQSGRARRRARRIEGDRGRAARAASPSPASRNVERARRRRLGAAVSRAYVRCRLFPRVSSRPTRASRRSPNCGACSSRARPPSSPPRARRRRRAGRRDRGRRLRRGRAARRRPHRRLVRRAVPEISPRRRTCAVASDASINEASRQGRFQQGDVRERRWRPR